MGKEHAIFSGDTLFIGDVGKLGPSQKKGSLTKEDLAGWLFDSLRNKIMVAGRCDRLSCPWRRFCLWQKYEPKPGILWATRKRQIMPAG